jgi:Acetyl/propionyl-CoA carboxylase, alpha subunit
LSAWGPTRGAAIEGMRRALDEFEVEGIGHNLPFCQAVMEHPRFVSGEISTAFIAEEYPEGFAGAPVGEDALKRLAAAAAAMNMIVEGRAAEISGAMRNHTRRVDPNWVVRIGEASFEVKTLETDDGAWDVTLDGVRWRVETDWRPGMTLAKAVVGGVALTAKVSLGTGGARVRWRGADLRVQVLTPRQAELAARMPVKEAADTSKMLLCPMPGLMVSVAVAEGDEVQEGQILCTVEAMKMENVLRAERRATVSKINAAPGASLAVDEVIMEFE